MVKNLRKIIEECELHVRILQNIPEYYLRLLQPVGDVAAEDDAAPALHVHLGIAAVYPHRRNWNERIRRVR